MSRKDAYYFPHDSNAKDDPKCVMLIEQLGLEGYGIFWVLVETLRDQKDYKYPIALLPAIARRYNTSIQKVETVVKAYGLFECNEESVFFSVSLINRMIPMETKRLQASEAGKKSAAKRKEIQRPFNDRSTDVEQPINERTNDRSTSKVKESKLENSKKDEIKKEHSKEEIKTIWIECFQEVSIARNFDSKLIDGNAANKKFESVYKSIVEKKIEKPNLYMKKIIETDFSKMIIRFE